MPRNRKIILIFCFLGLLIAGTLLYQIPDVKSRFDWRYEKLGLYIKNIIVPPGPVPTSMVASTLPAIITPATLPTRISTPTSNSEPTRQPIPPEASLPSPTWERQTPNNCGPATLSMALHMYGWKGNQQDIAEEIKPIIGDRNVNPEELQYYANNIANYSGWIRMEYRVGGSLQALKALIAANYPVVIEATTSLDPNDALGPTDDLWAAHYLLLTAYNDQRQEFISQDSYHGADRSVSYTKLEEEWEPFNYLYMVLYFPSDEDKIKAVLGDEWDPLVNRQKALEKAQSSIDANQNNAWGWFNLGTNLVAMEQYAEAARAYDKARTLSLPLRMFRYQFGPFIAYFRSDRIDDLLVLTEYARGITEMSEETWLWHGWALYRKGDIKGAIGDWNKALSINPKYVDARYALDHYGY
jgi:tetratricopeptide (TPR) repeat protein